MAKKKVAMLNPHSYERIDNNRFYIGSHLVGNMCGSIEIGYVWKSEYGYQGWDSDQAKAIRRMRKIYWYKTLRNKG